MEDNTILQNNCNHEIHLSWKRSRTHPYTRARAHTRTDLSVTSSHAHTHGRPLHICCGSGAAFNPFWRACATFFAYARALAHALPAGLLFRWPRTASTLFTCVRAHVCLRVSWVLATFQCCEYAASPRAFVYFAQIQGPHPTTILPSLT